MSPDTNTLLWMVKSFRTSYFHTTSHKTVFASKAISNIFVAEMAELFEYCDKM